MAHIKHSKSQEKLMDIMSELLKIDDNKYCVDCGSKGPRWASCTFGVFLCIRCAGIHRNMGVHISRIKSVDYDIWTSNQVDMMKKIGNSYGRVLYEANLDNNFLRPETDYALDKFIRSKYEHKLYIMKEQIPPTATVKERRLKQNPNDKKVNSRTRENIMILSNKKNIVTPISVKIMKKCHTGSATERFTVSSSANNSTFANNIDPESNSSTLSNINGPMNNLMNPRSNSLFQPEMAQNSDNVTDNDDFVSVPQPSISNYQTSTGSATELSTVSYSENSNVTVNTIGQIPYSSNFINNNAPVCQNSLMQSGYEMSESNHMVPGQINANNIVPLQQIINNFMFLGQSVISLTQLLEYNLFQISSLESRDFNLHVPIPESGDEFSIAHPETVIDSDDIEMTQLFNYIFNFN